MSERQNYNIPVELGYIHLPFQQGLENIKGKEKLLSWNEAIELERKFRLEFYSNANLATSARNQRNEASFPRTSVEVICAFHDACLKMLEAMKLLVKLLRRKAQMLLQ